MEKLLSVYRLHLNIVQKEMPDADESRHDAMVALRMRAENYSQRDVQQVILKDKLTTKHGFFGRNWYRYAEKAAQYAYGIAGQIDLPKVEQKLELEARQKARHTDDGVRMSFI